MFRLLESMTIMGSMAAGRQAGMMLGAYISTPEQDMSF